MCLINTVTGWRLLQDPTNSIAAAAADGRRLSMKMSDELLELCPSLGLHGAAAAAHSMHALMTQQFVPHE